MVREYEWNGYLIREYPGGCIHRAFPRGCGIAEYWCRGEWVATRRCGNDPVATARWEQHEARCSRHTPAPEAEE
jgi:hypothetical protein